MLARTWALAERVDNFFTPWKMAMDYVVKRCTAHSIWNLLSIVMDAVVDTVRSTLIDGAIYSSSSKACSLGWK